MIDKEIAIVFGIIVIIFAIVICILLKKGIKKTALVCIFIAYITAVVCIVFFPIPYDEEPIEYLNGYTWYNFVPFGFFVMMWMKKPKLWKMFVFAFAFTVIIEVTQMFLGFAIHSMYRNVDIDDVILNAIGAFIGFGLYKILPQRLKQKLTA